ncbi:MAG: homocysteine S-methyltransferase family protein [Bacteroidaceae bacterium]|nr:homocysteine S-methyltransferase family protein [Bacteroidaceae bacterium]
MEIKEALKERILILDGGMGTYIQQLGISYDGNNDALPLTHPELIERIHSDYVNAGSDIICTCTFGANAVSQHGYGLSDKCYEMNVAGAKIARKVADNCTDHKVWVMGSMGPSDKSLTIIEMMMDPEETVTSDILEAAYQTQAEGLIDGGVDGFIVETITDEKNALAALSAIEKAQKIKGTSLPVMSSATIMNTSGCIMTGTPIADLLSVLENSGVMSFGLNCSFGANELYPFIKELSEKAKCAISIYPNAGLPTAHGYDEGPCDTAHALSAMANDGLINIAGGCCGTTPDHIKEIKNHLKDIKPRVF